MEICNLKVINKGVVRCGFNLFVEKWGVEIKNLLFFQKGNSEWISFPSREYEEEGKKKYSPFIRFRDNKLMDAFSKQVIEAVKKEMEKEANEDIFG